MKNDLIERYIYAVIRYLPIKARDDVQKELEGLIEEMLEERCGDVLPTDKDIRIVLTELGDPEELAAKYIGDEGQALISGTYLLVYKRVLKIVLPIVAVVGIVSAIILALSLDGELRLSPYRFIGTLLGQTLGGTINAFAVITLVVAIFERKKITLNDRDMLAQLPQVPKAKAEIPPHSPLISMVWSVLAVVLFLGFPQLAGVWLEGVGWIPVFAIAVLRSLWIPIVLWAILGIAKETVKLVEGQYTKKVLTVVVAADLLTMISAAVVFLPDTIMNPEFISHIGGLFAAESGQAVSGLLTHFNVFFLGIVFFALLIEMVDVSVKVWRYRQ